MDHIQGHELCRANGDEKLPGIIKMIPCYSPVSLFAASTGFDCGDPFCLRKIDRITIVKTDKNSLCQF